ncbi:MAG: IS66 family insertion sequence element accessory protein TnpB [Planctomycetes bacterium]|nr:IS66 family insertion sequence element accessory protein TnpB [Planctomycetota bacterium]MCW8137933.1 IS66 family insertion sequence element accessory protein TnpB [Planctomycetota bacterium]
MIQLTPQMRVLVAIEAVDFRKGIDGLASVVRVALQDDPFSGAVFVFRNRRATALKVLVYDGQGYWLCQKRLSRGRFRHWPRAGQPARPVLAHELAVLLAGGDLEAAPGQPLWRPVAPATRRPDQLAVASSAGAASVAR